MTGDRPRDRLGRPLPRGSAPDPSVPPVPDTAGLTDEGVLALALTLVDGGLPFHAHEVCEERWRTCSSTNRDLWRALAQWGAAETHQARGNPEGARRLAERALIGIESCRASRVAISGIGLVVDRCRSLT